MNPRNDMTLHRLSYDQLKRLRDTLWRQFCYLRRLRERMQETKFADSDRFFRDIEMTETLLNDSVHLVESALEIVARRSPKRPR